MRIVMAIALVTRALVGRRGRLVRD